MGRRTLYLFFLSLKEKGEGWKIIYNIYSSSSILLQRGRAPLQFCLLLGRIRNIVFIVHFVCQTENKNKNNNVRLG